MIVYRIRVGGDLDNGITVRENSLALEIEPSIIVNGSVVTGLREDIVFTKSSLVGSTVKTDWENGSFFIFSQHNNFFLRIGTRVAKLLLY